MKLLGGGYHYYLHFIPSRDLQVEKFTQIPLWISGRARLVIQEIQFLCPCCSPLLYTGHFKLRWPARENKLEVGDLGVNFSSTPTSLIILPCSQKELHVQHLTFVTVSFSESHLLFYKTMGLDRIIGFQVGVCDCGTGSTQDGARERGTKRKGMLSRWGWGPSVLPLLPPLLLLRDGLLIKVWVPQMM